MSSSEERVGGVEPETVTCYLTWICEGCDACAPLDGSDRDEFPCTHDSPSVNGAWVVKAADHASALRSVEEELRQAREERNAIAGLYNAMQSAREELAEERDRAVGTVFDTRDSLDAAEADRDRLAGALRHAKACITEQVGPMPTPSQRLALNTIEAALSPVQGEHAQPASQEWRATFDNGWVSEWFDHPLHKGQVRDTGEGKHRSLRPVVSVETRWVSAPVRVDEPSVAVGKGAIAVQGEHEQGELDAAREALRYIADHALDVDCDGECAGVLVGMAQHFEDKFPPSRWQGEHEQDGEDTGVVGDSALSGESVRNDDSEATR